MSDSSVKIFITGVELQPDWWSGIALAEDGTALVGHVSSSKEWVKHDMGLNSTWKHDIYNHHYPDGYELVWVDGDRGDLDLEKHEGWMNAIARNKAMAPVTRSR